MMYDPDALAMLRTHATRYPPWFTQFVEWLAHQRKHSTVTLSDVSTIVTLLCLFDQGDENDPTAPVTADHSDPVPGTDSEASDRNAPRWPADAALRSRVSGRDNAP
jgi:hypothetical protein